MYVFYELDNMKVLRSFNLSHVLYIFWPDHDKFYFIRLLNKLY